MSIPAAVTLLPDLPIKTGDRHHWGAVGGAGLALTLAEAARRHTGVLLAITADTQSATRLEDELCYFLGDELPVLHFSDWETLPYDQFSPHQDIISARLRTLATLPGLQRGILVVPVSTLAQRIAPRGWLGGRSLSLAVKQKLDDTEFRRQLEAAGYTAVDTVFEHGEFAVRGSLIDLFPMGTEYPLRIELFDDEIAIPCAALMWTHNARWKTSTASSCYRPKNSPSTKPPSGGSATLGPRLLKATPKRCSVYQDVINGLAAGGIEYYLPLFFDETGTLFDYLPAGTLCMVDAGAHAQIGHVWNEIRNRYESRRHDTTRPLLPPEKLFLRDNELFEAINRFPRIEWQTGPVEEKAGSINLPFQPSPTLPVDGRSDTPLQLLLNFLQQHEEARVLFTTESAGRRESLLELLARSGLKPTSIDNWQGFLQMPAGIAITVAPLEYGLWLHTPELIVIAESQLFGQRVMQRRRRKASSQDISGEMIVKNLSELNPGAPVVHIDHGVGRYQGLVTLDIDNQSQEFLLLEYADKAKLYVPVSSLHLIARYSGADDAMAPLHRLGTEQWTKARRKAAEQVRDTAAELLNIYARRAARPGHAFDFSEMEYQHFAAGFPFEETADQAAAIIATISDLRAPRPMDRLVCGDVGFGKTEVAMRAAFVAVQGGRQVAVLVPHHLARAAALRKFP
jgi:transcription-repair coupling factor (superfamily II helicase)